MDIIFLRGLQIDTVIGIYDWERQIRQTVIIDLELATDIRRAAATDDIAHTLDYKAVSKRITAFVEESTFFLVETLAEKITAILLEEFSVPWVRLTLNKKGAISGATDVDLFGVFVGILALHGLLKLQHLDLQRRRAGGQLLYVGLKTGNGEVAQQHHGCKSGKGHQAVNQ